MARGSSTFRQATLPWRPEARSDSAFIKYSQNAPPIDPTPRIDRFFASVQRAIAGDPFTLNVTRVHDPDRRFQTISFYRDNGDGVLEPADDFLVGADANSSGGWSVTASTAGLAAGTYTFFAQGSDIDGVVLAEAAIDVVVIEGEVASYASMNVPQAIPDLTTITSTLTVPDSFSILDLDVALDITHTGDTNLDVYLIAPDGTRVELFTDVGGLGTILAARYWMMKRRRRLPAERRRLRVAFALRPR